MQIISWDKNAVRKIEALSKTTFDMGLLKVVNKIVSEVHKKGDSALRKFTKDFDGVDVPTKKLQVTQGEINRAYEQVDVKFVHLLTSVIDNVKRYYKKEICKGYRIKTKEGAILGKRYLPIDRVGVYIPGGQAPLVSTICMTAVPAQVAGVKDVVMVTPPNSETGYVNPHLLVVADLLGIKEIYKAGGAQAIAALAFGTKTIPKVDKIVGPGNQYVTEAKRQVFGFVDIDMTAGPSEVAIIADQQANVEYVLADMYAQAEHVGGLSVLITTSKRLAEQVKKQYDMPAARVAIVLVKTLDEAAVVSDLIAPEHLQIMTKTPSRVLKSVRHAGAIFIGPYSPAVVGDYVAGPSHVLPTGGTARYFSPLSASDFIKGSQYIQYTKEALVKHREILKRMTEIEGLFWHGRAVEKRFES